jgi:hypothetical protein
VTKSATEIGVGPPFRDSLTDLFKLLRKEIFEAGEKPFPSTPILRIQVQHLQQELTSTTIKIAHC